ncbi:MAG: hypothetical protein ACI4AD_04250, partial [Roseburia sp.]
IAKALEAVFQLANKVIEKISELIGYVMGGDFDSLYDLLLMCSYMCYDLPDRTCAQNGVSITVGEGGLTYATNLKGSAVTGYSYSDIVVSNGVSPTGVQGLDGLIGMLTSDSTYRTDTMFKGAELEYIIAGTESEYMNQIVAFLDLYILRLLMNIPVVFTDGMVAEMAAAATIASWAVYLIVLLGEPLCDSILLVNGEDSYLLKNGCYLTPKGIPKLIDKIAGIAIGNETLKNEVVSELNSKVKGKLPATTSEGVFSEGGVFKMDYKTHMLIILLTTTTEADMLYRLANLIQLEASSYYQKEGASFDIKKTYTAVHSKTKVTYNSFLDKLLEITDRSAFTKTYEKYRSY